MTLSVILYKNLGFSNTDIALYTSWLYLPRHRRCGRRSSSCSGASGSGWWCCSSCSGRRSLPWRLTLPGPQAFKMSLAVFWLMAFASASHDIAADGFICWPAAEDAGRFCRRALHGLSPANIGGQGGLVWLAGTLAERTGSVVTA